MKKVISLFFQVLIFFIALALIASLSYIIGRQYLIFDGLMGTDSYSFYSVVLSVSEYFPKINFWYPLAGGGVSIISGYPVFAAYLVTIIDRFSSLDLMQSFKLLGFLSVPLLSLGVFFLVYLRLTEVKNRIVRAVLGLIAAVFVVISPNSWLWLTRWGFYAETVSYIFIPWAILFFDLFLENAIEGKHGWGYKIGILGTSIFLLLCLLTHYLSVASLVVFFVIVAVTRYVMALGNRKLVLKRILLSGLLLALLFGGMAFFKLFQYQFYMQQVSLGGGSSGNGIMAYSEMANNTLPLSMMLSLTAPTTIMDTHALIFDMRFPLYVWILFTVGLLFSIKKSKKIFSFGVYGVLGLILTSVISIRYLISGIPIISMLANFMEERGYLVVARVIIPVVAVYGAYIIWETLFKKIISKINFVNEFLSLIFALGTVTTLVCLFYNSPYKPSYMVGTGVGVGVSDIRDIWNKKPKNNDKTEYYIASLTDQLKLKEWPVFSINSNISTTEKKLRNIFAPLPTTEEYRFDPSTFAGGISMATPLITQNSQIQIYINTLSLIHNSWSYQAQVMYSNLTTTQKPGVLTELGKWYGLNYVYLSGSEQEPLTYWQEDKNWEKLGDTSALGGWEKFNVPVSLTTWDNRPKILVVSDVKRGLYDQTFRFATWGGIPFDKANIIIGQASIDSYSLADLKKYDAVIMRGYSYKSQSSAYNLLNQYVSGGGKLIFDTGWQFETPDYILDKTPDFMPFGSLVWKNLNTNSSYSLAPEFSGIDIAKFGDLKYSDSSWGVSVPENLKSWANIDLSFDGKPLVISGKYGNGEVIWIGFNIVAHATAKDSQEEANFFNVLTTNLIGSKQISNLNTVYTRINPDKVEFDLQNSTTDNSGIYFRESYFPYWKATLLGGNKRTNLKIEKAGPGFMYINLPPVTSDDKVILEIQISIWQKIANLISVTFGVLVLVIFVDPAIFFGIKIPKIKVKIKLPKFGTSKDENEDY